MCNSESSLTEAQRVAHIENWRWDANADGIWWYDELYRIYEKPPGSPLPSFEEAKKLHPGKCGTIDLRCAKGLADWRAVCNRFGATGRCRTEKVFKPEVRRFATRAA